MQAELDLHDIQGLILSGYGDRPAARYGLFQVVDAARARRWLAELIPELQFGDYRKTAKNESPYLKPLCANIALTHPGLRSLGLGETALAGFSEAYREGMHEPHRARRLGDDGPSSPENWAWGSEQRPVHGVLAVYAGLEDADEGEWAIIEEFLTRHLCGENGVVPLLTLDTLASNRAKRREHFGFRDGITNPGIAGLSRSKRAKLAPGEIILGYKNGYGRLPLSPEVESDHDPHGHLPRSSETANRRDFGKNGSYLVFRQLHQNVHAFWSFVAAAGARVPRPSTPGGDERGPDAAGTVSPAVWLASKLVGRWPNGTALTVHPRVPGPDEAGDDDAFLFGDRADAYGDRCPIGAHIRRTNPRDTALPVPHDPELSGTPEDEAVRESRLRFSDLHRVLRRGRPYGEPVDPNFDPAVLASQPDDGKDRGIHFLCFNANLGRQFEFVQSNWINNPCFAGLSRDPDPLLAADRAVPFPANEFTIQGYPPRRLRGLPRVVEVRGGAYFFMPSRSALLYLSSL